MSRYTFKTYRPRQASKIKTQLNTDVHMGNLYHYSKLPNIQCALEFHFRMENVRCHQAVTATYTFL